MKLNSTKFILTVFLSITSIVFRCLNLISGDQLVSILQIIVPAYFAGNVIAGHRAFQPPQVTTNVVNTVEDIVKNIKGSPKKEQ